MAFDIGKWGADLGLSADEVKQAEALLNKPERIAKLEKGYLAQADYSRQMNEGQKKLGDAQADYERRGKELQESLEAMDRLRGDTTGALEKEQKRAQALEERAIRSEMVLRRVATQAGLEPDEVVKEIGVEVVPRTDVKPAPTEDLTKMFDQFGQRVGTGFRTMAEMQGELFDIQAEHQALFGKPLVGSKALIDEVLKSGGKVSVRDVWEKTHNVAQAKEEAHEKEIERRISEARKDEGIKVRSEMELGVSRGSESGFEFDSPVLRNVKPVDPKNARGAGPGNAASIATAQGLRERIAKIRASGVR